MSLRFSRREISLCNEIYRLRALNPEKRLLNKLQNLVNYRREDDELTKRDIESLLPVVMTCCDRDGWEFSDDAAALLADIRRKMEKYIRRPKITYIQEELAL